MGATIDDFTADGVREFCQDPFFMISRPIKSIESFSDAKHCDKRFHDGVVVPLCNPLTLQPEQSGRVGSIPGRTPQWSVMTRRRGLDSLS